jgi:hypothetical protein
MDWEKSNLSTHKSDDPKNLVCPYLGVVNDPQTRYSFPETLNCCHRVSHPQRVALDHQGEVCLSGSYSTCPVYAAAEWKGPLPKELKGIQHKASQTNTMVSMAVGGLVVVVIAAVLFFSHPGAGSQSGDATPASAFVNDLTRSATPAGLSSATPTEELTPTEPAIIASPTAWFTPIIVTPTPTIILSPTTGPLANTPFGPNGRYLVYKVNDGDMMENMAKLFHTSPLVLKALNGLKPDAGFWPGMMAVVAVGEADPNAVFPMQAVWLDQPMRLDVLAQKYKTSEDDLRAFNGLGPGDTVPGGRWIVAKKQ